MSHHTTRRERILASPNFRDGRFHNTAPVGAGLKSGYKLELMNGFLFQSKKPRIPPAPLPADDPRPIWQSAPRTGLRTTWLGHSSMLLEFNDIRILTDPMFGPRASPVGFAGPRRFQPAPIIVDDLPPLDAVLISHDHYDHLDHPTILQLTEKPEIAPRFITSLGVGAHLEAWGIAPDRITELDWWENITLESLTITATPAQHFSGRGLTDRNSTFWSSFVLQDPDHTVFFGADSGLTPEFSDIARRFGPFDLCMLEIGAYHPAWGDIHLGPHNALEAMRLLGGGHLLPIHWGTFDLGLHPWNQPIEDLLELATQQTHTRLVLPRPGQPIESPDSSTNLTTPWWRNEPVSK